MTNISGVDKMMSHISKAADAEGKITVHNATIEGKDWYFAPGGFACFKGDFGPGDGRALAMSTGCDRFVESETGNVISPKFLFQYDYASNHPIIYCNGTRIGVTPSESGIEAVCSDLHFSPSGNANFHTNSSDFLTQYSAAINLPVIHCNDTKIELTSGGMISMEASCSDLSLSVSGETDFNISSLNDLAILGVDCGDGIGHSLRTSCHTYEVMAYGGKVMTIHAKIVEKDWYFAPKGIARFEGDFGPRADFAPTTSTGCYRFVESETGNVISPKFLFQYDYDSSHPIIHCNGTRISVISNGSGIEAVCSDWHFPPSGNANFHTNSSDFLTQYGTAINLSVIPCDGAKIELTSGDMISMEARCANLSLSVSGETDFNISNLDDLAISGVNCNYGL